MKRPIILLLFFSFFLTHALSQERFNIDSIYSCLDDAIAHADSYKQQVFDSLSLQKQQLSQLSQPQQRYQSLINLSLAYRSLHNDSTLAYLYRALEVAKQIKRRDLQSECYLRIGHQHALTGYYTEARMYLDRADASQLDEELLATRYNYYSHLYREIAFYTTDSTLKADFTQQALTYRDSLNQISRPDTVLYYQRRCIGLCAAQKPIEAMQVNDEWRKRTPKGSFNYATMAYYRSDIYMQLGNIEAQKFWLAESSISDIKNAIANQASLWTLANIINSEGDIERANRYMEFSWDAISHFNAHKRGWLATPVMDDINRSYKSRLSSANNKLSILVSLVGVLAIILMALLFLVLKERRIISDARTKLQSINNELQTANQELLSLNARLLDSNRVKDFYITRFLSICSGYIEKIDNYRQKVNRKLKANQMKDLLKMTSSEQIKKDELEELLQNFDSAFLNLFPSFVNEFNLLLRPEERIELPDRNTLNTELRIFALIRLGINESSKIAEFLDYSPNSIYAYRARTKNKALCDREKFEDHVRNIGMILPKK